MATGQTSNILLQMMDQHRDEVDRRLQAQAEQTERRFTELATHVTNLTKNVGELTKTLAQQQGARAALEGYGHRASLVVAALSGVALDHLWKFLF